MVFNLVCNFSELDNSLCSGSHKQKHHYGNGCKVKKIKGARQ